MRNYLQQIVVKEVIFVAPHISQDYKLSSVIIAITVSVGTLVIRRNHNKIFGQTAILFRIVFVFLSLDYLRKATTTRLPYDNIFIHHDGIKLG